jgi:hypothetical protein
MNFRTRTLLAGAVMLLLTPAAFAQRGDRDGDRDNRDRGGDFAQRGDYATFYENGDFKGFNFTLTQSEPNFGRPGLMNDKASSARLRGRWLLCTNGDYRGQCKEASGDIRDLNFLGLNDSISSARYLGPDGPGRPGPGGPPPRPVLDRGKLERDINRAMDTRDYRAALDLIDDYRGLPGPLPKHMLVQEARAALDQGKNRRASDALDQYFKVADRRDPDYREARELSKRLDRR